MPKQNRERVLIIAEALGDLCDKVVFVGGSVSEFYCGDSASATPRPTDDVDCVVNLSTYSSYMRFCEELLSHKFYNDTSENAPMCRFVFEGTNVVDIMPVESTGIGESNRWYKPGFAFRKAYEISAGKIIYLLPVGYYVATKLEALFSRGGDDYRGSSDFEDIVYVINSCNNLMESVVQSTDKVLLAYLSESFSALLERGNIDEEIECALFTGDEDRREYVKSVFKNLASISRIAQKDLP